MNLAQGIDFNSLMEPVALRLLGEPAQKHGHEWRYGNRGSLSIDLAKGHWFDHEANTGGGVFDLIKREGHEQPAAWLRREGLLATPQVVGRPQPRIVKTYDYCDENGTLLFQVVRFEPKDFRQRRPDGRGGWIWNLHDTRRVPYLLPELVKAVAAGQTVYIPEGEKDADNLCAIGLAATTNPGGIKKWRHEYSEYLRGADVVVLPDNHDEGREHGDQVVASLRGIAKRVRILDIGKHWADCPDKGDVSDWLAAGGSAEKLREIVEALPERVEKRNYEQSNETHIVDEWPTLNEAAYHGLAGEVVRTIEPHSEADPVAILLQFLTAFGNAVDISPHYQIEGDKHRAKLFVVLSGTTSKGRKGTALGRIRQLMATADQSWELDNIQSGLSTGEGLIFHVRDPVSKIGKDGAVELVDSGVTDKRLMIVTEEFAGTLRVMERAGNTLSPVLRDAWGTSKLQTLTKNSPIKATDSHISVIAHITDDELRAVLTRVEMANGFANRFLFARVRRSKLLPHGGHLDFDTLQDLGERIAARLRQARTLERIFMTAAAATAWDQTYAALSGERQGLLGAVLGRAEAQATRLALIYALLDNSPQIDIPHLEAGIAVWEYCEASAAHIFANSLGDPVADEILRALHQAGGEGLSRNAIRDHFGRNQSSDRIGAALALLKGKGLARARMRGTGGRPVEIWFARGVM
jgi:hypothetical protein